MTDNRANEKLVPLWEQHRNRILRYGHALHALLPEGEPAITLHGRDLRPADEGVGFQFQYTLTGDLYNGEVTTACFVVQIELVKRETSVAVRVDAAPLLEFNDKHIEVYGRRDTLVPLGDKWTLRRFFAQPLTRSATGFFNRVRAGEPMDEVIAGYAESIPSQQVTDS
jgi:hypothetical protein